MRALLERRCACGRTPGPSGECATCKAKRLQRSAKGPGPALAPPIVHDVLHSAGRPLEPSVRGPMETRFGHDFSRVRVHTDGRAAESALAVNANAYTVGSDVVFGAGRYAPRTTEGSRLLAHELAHTVQQGRGASGIALSDTVLERDAERTAASSGVGRADVTTSTGTRLSRQAAAPATTPRVSKIEIFCAVNEMHFHTAERVIVYELTDCDLDEGEYDVRVDIDRRKRVVAFKLGEDAPKGVRFRFNYLIGVDQRAPIDLLEGQQTVHVVASNRVPEEADETGGASPAAPDLRSNVDYLTPEEVQRRCESGDLRVKTFPFRATRLGAAPIDAWREGAYIRVKQPVYVSRNADFRDQLRTLPPDTFVDGVLLYPDEIVRVHTYEPPWYKFNLWGWGSTGGDKEHEFCATGEQMLEVAEKSTRATLFNVGLTAVEALPVGKLAGPLAKLGKAVVRPIARLGQKGLLAGTLGTARAVPGLAGASSRTAVTLVERQAETQVIGRAAQQAATQTVAQSTERRAAEAAATVATDVAVPSAGGGTVASAATTAGVVAGEEIGGDLVREAVASPGEGVKPHHGEGLPPEHPAHGMTEAEWKAEVDRHFEWPDTTKQQLPDAPENLAVPRIKRGRIEGIRARKRAPTRRVDFGDIRLYPGETGRRAVARVRRLIGKRISDTPLGVHWQNARAKVLLDAGVETVEQLGRQRALNGYKKAQQLFWDSVRRDPEATKFVGDLGFEIGESGAPKLLVNDPAFSVVQTRVTLDHSAEKAFRENWKLALDGDKLIFEFHDANRFKDSVQRALRLGTYER